MFKPRWNIENIKESLDRFISEYGQLPTAHEMDKLEYLPSARTIQREFGGLEKLRKELGYDTTHFGKGEKRSNLAKNINTRGKASEKEILDVLTEKFGEMFVHIERPFTDSSKQRLDFFVFSPSGNFGIDVFFPIDTYSMIGSLNIKKNIYKNFKQIPLYLVVANSDIPQQEIDRCVQNQKTILQRNIRVISLITLKELINPMSYYTTN